MKLGEPKRLLSKISKLKYAKTVAELFIGLKERERSDTHTQRERERSPMNNSEGNFKTLIFNLDVILLLNGFRSFKDTGYLNTIAFSVIVDGVLRQAHVVFPVGAGVLDHNIKGIPYDERQQLFGRRYSISGLSFKPNAVYKMKVLLNYLAKKV